MPENSAEEPVMPDAHAPESGLHVQNTETAAQPSSEQVLPEPAAGTPAADSADAADESIASEQFPAEEEPARDVPAADPIPRAGAIVTSDADKPRGFHLPAPEQLLPGFLRRRLGRAARYIALSLVVIVLGAAGGGAWMLAGSHARPEPKERFAAVILPFQVVSTVPAAGAPDVADGTKIVINFSRAVTPEKLNGDFFVSPQVDGTFSAGANNRQVIFTPSVPFTYGTVVQVMIHGEFQSDDGTALGADYSFGFTMATPDDSVFFYRNNFGETVDSVSTGTSPEYTLSVGKDVDTSGTITVYKSDMSHLLSNLIYVDKTYSGGNGTYLDFANTSVDTSGLPQVQTVLGLKDNSTLKISQGDGVYAVVAASKGKQVGYMWLVVSSLGVVARQDDQQVVLMGQDDSTGKPVTISATLYSLHNSVQKLSSATINGSGSMSAAYSPRVDAVVATTGDGKAAFVPLAVPLTLADVRVKEDLSTATLTYGLTDRPTYAVGDQVQYAGFVRVDNDAQYTLASAGSRLKLYVATGPWNDHLADFTAPVDSSGTVHGSFTVGGNFAGDQQTQQLSIYSVIDTNIGNDQPIASFTVTKNKPSADSVHVSFAKSDYVASDTIAATVSATDANGAPLANAKLAANLYVRQYYENNPEANQAALDSGGTKLNDQPVSVVLDANGKATVPVDVSKFPAGSSQVITVQASINDAAGNTAGGGASAVVHQGNAMLVFGTSRSVIAPGGEIVARVYPMTLGGSTLSGASVTYKLTTTDYSSSTPTVKQVASGQTTANTAGLAEIHQTVPSSYGAGTTFDLQVSTSDANNNKVTADEYFYVRNADNTGAFSEMQLANLDVSGSATDVTVGHTLNLTVNAPHDITALVSLERGRIHKYEVVDLKAGDNSYTVQVTQDLAPSFSLVFSYLDQGVFNTEGATYDVSPADKQATLTVTPDKPSYSAGATATVAVKAQDGTGAPVATSVILGVVDATAYNLNSQVTPDIFTFLYGPREITTNSSSSLTGLGSGGGKCGGGGADQPSLINPLGSTLLWNPTLTTAADGTVSAQVMLPKGTWRIYAYSMSAGGLVGSTHTTVAVQ